MVTRTTKVLLGGAILGASCALLAALGRRSRREASSSLEGFPRVPPPPTPTTTRTAPTDGKPLETWKYSVNGEVRVATKNRLDLETILLSVGKDAAVDPEEIDMYILEDIRSMERYGSLSDVVRLGAGANEFVAIHTGWTPVAEPHPLRRGVTLVRRRG